MGVPGGRQKHMKIKSIPLGQSENNTSILKPARKRMILLFPWHLGQAAVLCGPPIMIRFTFPKLMPLRFPNERIYTSLEKRMKCGIAKCGRWNIRHLDVCKDGPVFS
jgi:NAD(P)H-flavin reductase